MVRRIWVVASLVALICGALLVSGCVSSSEDEARTPTGAETVVNSAVQTDENGETVVESAPEEPTEPAEPAEPGAGGEVEGDAAAGEQVFASSCTSCHMDNGKSGGGFGPQLAGAGLDAAAINGIVSDGQGAMPGGLVSGDDLTNVVAYVASLQ